MSHVAFIRNVMQGRRGLTRALLLETFGECGGAGAQSFLTTGNVIFTPVRSTASEVVGRVAARLEEQIGLREPLFVRTLAELRAAGDPFAEIPQESVYERCVTFLPEVSTRLPPLPLTSRRGDVEVLAASGREVYSVTRLVGGRPGALGPLIEGWTGTPVTSRNWRTVERLLARFGP